jgi:predicted transcriptional regulator
MPPEGRSQQPTGLARELGRDGNCVQEDVGQLMACGLVARTKDRKCHVSYDLIHADFDLRAAA